MHVCRELRDVRRLESCLGAVAESVSTACRLGIRKAALPGQHLISMGTCSLDCRIRPVHDDRDIPDAKCGLEHMLDSCHLTTRSSSQCSPMLESSTSEAEPAELLVLHRPARYQSLALIRIVWFKTDKPCLP